MTTRRWAAGAATLALCVSLLAACGSDDGGSDGGDTSDRSTTNTDAAAEVEKLLAGDVEFTMPTEAVDPGDHRVAVIASGLASPGPSTLATNAMNAIEALGWQADAPGDGKFTPTTQASLIEKAVLDGVDGIILIAITPNAVAAAINAAEDADIPVVCALCGPGAPEGIISVGNDHPAAGRAQAAYAASTAEPGDVFVVYQNSEFEASKQQMQETASYLEELCPECTVETPSLLLAEAVVPNAPIFTSLLNEYQPGEVKAVILPFDSPAATLANSAAQLGRTDFDIIGFGSLAPFIDMVGAGQPPTARADVTISTPFYGWAAVDQLARALAGLEAWESDDLPVGLVDQTTFGDFEPGQFFILPDFDYEAEFQTLWGL
jgi:ABC-type sugar transport system substrate-binding protein